MSKILADNLKYLREVKGMSQEDLAEVLHVKRQTVSSWERDVTEPDILTMQQLCQYFSVTVDEFTTYSLQSKRGPKVFMIISLLCLTLSVVIIVILAKQFDGFKVIIEPLIFLGATLLIFLVSIFSYYSNDYSLFAGYEDSFTYNKLIVVKSIQELNIMVHLNFLLALVVYYILLKINSPAASVILFVMFLSGLLLAVIRNTIVYKDSILIHKKDQTVANVLNKLGFTLLAGLFLLIGAFLAIFILFKIENNTNEAFIMLLPMFYTLGMIFYFHFKEYNYVKSLDGDLLHYSFKKYFKKFAIGVLIGIVAILIIAILVTITIF